MKRKTIEKLIPAPTKRKGLVATVQEIGDILILNIYQDKKIQSRYCVNTKSGEYETFDCKSGEWKFRKLLTAIGFDAFYSSAYRIDQELAFNSEEERKLAEEKVKEKGGKWNQTFGQWINRIEDDFNRNKRETHERNRRDRVRKVMDAVPMAPRDLREWIWEKTGAADYAFYDKKKKLWNCTCCEEYVKEKDLQRTDGEKKIRHNDMIYCKCGKIIQAKKRTGKIEKKEHVMVLQPVCDKYSVARHFTVELNWEGRKRKIDYSEEIRVVLFKLSENPKFACDIYYDNWGGFDNRGNPWNKHTYAGYLYEDGIEEALQDTSYRAWSRVFQQMAAVGQKVNWNRLMATKNDEKLVRMVECLFKGRFFKLLQETAEDVSYWSCEYTGELNTHGTNIEEVFNIHDRQKINRIRDINGGKEVVSWMRWSDRKGVKIPQETLEWLLKNDISQSDLWFILDVMKPQQIQNYILRQQKESYIGKSIKTIIGQWKDYLNMCRRMRKKMDDEMIYRPRELKRRHDEAVAEIALREAEIKADEYNKRFPGVEDVLERIREQFEYSNEEYVITVPRRCIDIVAEGRYLHHCAGATDRYFDRIKQQETYICFLRKVAEPTVPFYTIEVEPGGTIRQHRGMFDEEPDIEKIKPFLREWQKEIKKRMREEDKKLAKISAIKREKNLAELREKNNTRVLQGLMEDFMEAI